MDTKSKLSAILSVGMIVLALTILGIFFVTEGNSDVESSEKKNTIARLSPVTNHIIPITNGETRRITTDNNTEWLTFTITQTTHAQITVDRTDVVLALLSNNREELLAVATPAEGNTQQIAVCNEVALLPGVYEIGVESEQTPLTYQVTLTFNLEPCTTNIPAAMLRIPADIYEPDTHLISATIITNGDIQTHTLHTADDEDFLTFTLTETTNVMITTNGETGDPVLELYRSNGTLLAYNDDSTEDSFSNISLCNENALPAGTYTILIHTFEHQTTVPSYQVALMINGVCSADVHEFSW